MVVRFQAPALLIKGDHMTDDEFVFLSDHPIAILIAKKLNQPPKPTHLAKKYLRKLYSGLGASFDIVGAVPMAPHVHPRLDQKVLWHRSLLPTPAGLLPKGDSKGGVILIPRMDVQNGPMKPFKLGTKPQTFLKIHRAGLGLGHLAGQ